MRGFLRKIISMEFSETNPGDSPLTSLEKPEMSHHE